MGTVKSLGAGQSRREVAYKALGVRPKSPWNAAKATGCGHGTGDTATVEWGHGQSTGDATKEAVTAWQSGRRGASKALGARPRQPWGQGQGPGGGDKAAICFGPWLKGRGQGDLGDAVRALGTLPRQPRGCSKGLGGAAMAAVGMQPRPWVLCQDSHGIWHRPWGCGQGPEVTAKGSVAMQPRPRVLCQGSHGVRHRPWVLC